MTRNANQQQQQQPFMEWTEDWDQKGRPPSEYELLRECCRRLRHIRAAVWTIAGVILAGLALGFLGLLVSATTRHY
jgi:hypothetical protein